MTFEWLVGPSIALKALGTKYFTPMALHGFTRRSKNWLRRAAYPNHAPQSRVTLPNACVFGRALGSSTLAVTESLLKELNADEVKAVIGHELGHLKHKDCIVLTLLNAIPTLCFIIATIAFFGLRGPIDREDKDRKAEH